MLIKNIVPLIAVSLLAILSIGVLVAIANRIKGDREVERIWRSLESSPAQQRFTNTNSNNVCDTSIYCRGKALPIGVNLSSNAYSTGILPHPSIPAPNPQRGPRVPRKRGGEVLRQQSRGGVTRILMVGDLIQNHVLARVSR